MNNFFKNTILIILITSLILSFSFAEKRNLDIRKIGIAGLVVNAQTLLPVENAEIHDINNKLIGTTDPKGYFNITIDYLESGEVIFKLKIISKGYQTFTEYDHWGDMKTNTKKVMYFGLKPSKSNADPFSLFGSTDETAYKNVLNGFDEVKAEKKFNDELTAAKKGNENTLVKIDGRFYIVDNGGWIMLNTDKDSIYLNDKELIMADKLNTTIKRNKIRGMSPIGTKSTKFVIYTK